MLESMEMQAKEAKALAERQRGTDRAETSQQAALRACDL